MVASVTMNGWMRSAAITAPFTAPTGRRGRQPPVAIAIAIRACPQRVSTIATSVVESARMLPTLRSMPPVRITNVIASEMMPISETCRRMSVRLPACRKMREPSDAVGLIAMARIRMPSSANRLSALRSRARHQASGSATERFGGRGHDRLLGGVPGIVDARSAVLRAAPGCGREQRSSSGSSELTRMTPLPAAARLVDDAVDVLLGADIDAAGGVVEEQHGGIAQQPARQQDLLLIAAAQRAHRRHRATRT